MKYDVVIIGSGWGGLVCARELSKEGRSVLVLEQHEQAGGCLQSYRRGGQTFDTGLHYVGGLAEGQRLHRVFSHLGLMTLPWQRLDDDGFDRITIGQETYRFAQGYDRFAETLAEQFPACRQALREYAALLQQVDQLPLGSPEVQRLGAVNAYDYLCEHFADPLLVNVLAGSAMKTELRRETLPLFTFAHANSSYVGSSWRLRGSGSMMVGKLVADIEAAGGRIVTGSEVVSLKAVDGRIVAAVCKNGECYEGQHFISDIHPTMTFALVKEDGVLSRLFRRRINALENTFGMLTVSLALKPDTLPYFNHNKFVYDTADVWALHEQANGVGGVMVSCQAPADGAAFVQQIDLLAPVHTDLFAQWKDTRVGHRGEEYRRLKQQMAARCVELAGRVVPGLAGMVSHTYVSTPLSWRDYTLTPDGSAYGVRKDCRQPLLTMLSPRTPVSNLLLTGQSLMLHGVEGVTMTALMTCAELLGTDYIQKNLEI